MADESAPITDGSASEGDRSDTETGDDDGPEAETGGDDRPGPEEVADGADRVVLSYRSPETDPDGRAGWVFDGSDWAHEELNEESYRGYLRRVHAGPVAVGDEWTEFVSTGCGGRTDVLLRVERVEGGSAIGAGTDIEAVPRRSVVE